MTDRRSVELQFDDNRLIPLLYGEHNSHLMRLEQQLGVALATRGGRVTVSGPVSQVQAAQNVLDALWERLKKGVPLTGGDVDAAVRMVSSALSPAESSIPKASFNSADLTIKTRRSPVFPRSPTQATYLKALQDHELVFGLGPAGTGKTYLAVAHGVSLLVAGLVERIILSRPAVEAGERLGFLPGDMKEKVDPYLRPLYDALHDMMPPDQIAKRLETGVIEVAPLAFMRGRTLSDAFVILDEAQNTTPMQMKMFLTRLGEGSRMVITGDITQIDLPHGVHSGLADAVEVLHETPGVSFVQFSDMDVVRHPLVAKIVRAYDKRDTETGHLQS